MDANFVREIKKTVRQIPKPYGGYEVSTVLYPDGLVTLRVYEDQIMSFSQDRRADILLYLETAQSAVRALGVRCELEGVQGDGAGR